MDKAKLCGASTFYLEIDVSELTGEEFDELRYALLAQLENTKAKVKLSS